MTSVNFNIQAVLGKNKKHLQERLVLVGAMLETEAKSRTPIDTGRAVDSIIWATYNKSGKMGSDAKKNDDISRPSEELTVKVGSNVDYFKYIEFGTKIMRRSAPLRTALIAVKNKGAKIFL